MQSIWLPSVANAEVFVPAAAHAGAVTLIQRFGSALNLNIHFHMLFLDGVYVGEADSSARFRWVKALAFSAHKHRDQRRKDIEASPCINHPIALANILCNEGHVIVLTLTLWMLYRSNFEQQVESLHAMVREQVTFPEHLIQL